MRRVGLARRKRGLSSVVGAIFLVLIIVMGFNLITLSMSYYDEYSAVLSERSRVEWERINERIELVDFAIDSGKFNLTLQNTGSLTVRLVRLWVTNETASPQWHDKFDIDYYVASKGVVTNIGQSLDLYANSSAGYVFKVVTERGSMSSFRTVPPSEVVASMSLHVLSPAPVNGTDVEVIFVVTNNATGVDALYNLIPQLNITVPSTANATLENGPEPSLLEVLPRGSSAFFRWIYDVSGGEGDIISFNASLVNGNSDNFATANATIHTVKFAEQSGISLSSESLNLGAPALNGTLFWHRYTELDGYQMDPQPVTDNERKVTLKNDNPTVRFYTKNSTDQISIPAGDWTIDFHYKPKDNNNAPQLRILYQITSNDGTTVIQTLANYTVTLCQCDNDQVYTDTRSLSAVDVTAQDRLRVSLTWLSGDDVEIKWDKDNRDSYLKTPTPTPLFPSYDLTFNGDDFWVTVKNTANLGFWLNYQTRAVSQDTTNSNQSYASIAFNWKETNSTFAYDINEDKDTRLLLPGDAIALHFSKPTTAPSKNGDRGDPIPSGTYMIYVQLIGYDVNGAFMTTIVAIGPANF